jgi:hypothetical protein
MTRQKKPVSPAPGTKAYFVEGLRDARADLAEAKAKNSTPEQIAKLEENLEFYQRTVTNWTD